MDAIFVGNFENKVDAKGRMSIPADFRKELEAGDSEWVSGRNARMHLVWGTPKRDFIEIMPMARREKLRRQIGRMPGSSAKRAALIKTFIINAQTCSVDETGRIVLPGPARERLALDGTAHIVGGVGSFTLWHPQRYTGDFIGVVPEDDFDEEADASAWIEGDEAWDEDA